MDNHKKNVLVTGATGFIGRNLVAELARLNQYNIYCLLRNPQKADLVKPYGVRVIYGDITDKSSLNRLLQYKIDIVFHCAGLLNNKHPCLLHKVNVTGTENICAVSLRLGVERFVYLSSVAVVSGNPQVPLVEDLPYRTTNIYGESKKEAEKKALEYRNKGLRIVIIRPCMVYGEGEPHLIRRLLFLLKWRLLPVLNGGNNRLHLVYVKNVVDLMIFVLDKDEFLEGTFFIADREALTVKEVYRYFARGIRARPPFVVPARFTPLLLNLPVLGKKLRFSMKDRVYSTDRIRSLGFRPRYPAPASLTKSARHFKH